MFYSTNATIYLCFYNYYILPIIDYGSIFYLYALKSSIQRIEKLQKRFTRLLFKRTHNSQIKPHYDSRLTIFGLQKLHDRYLTSDLVTLFKIIKGHLNTPSIRFRFSSKTKHRILLPTINYNRTRNSFFIRSLTRWNSILKKTPLTLPELKRNISLKLSQPPT